MALYVKVDHKNVPWKAALMALPTRQVWVLEGLSPTELLLLLPALPLTCYVFYLLASVSFTVKSKEMVFCFTSSLGCLDENHRAETKHFV